MRPSSPGEPARLHRGVVGQPHRLAGGQPVGQALLQQLLDAPQLGAEVPEQVAVGVQPPELAGQFHGDDLGVGQHGRLQPPGPQPGQRGLEGPQLIIESS